MAEAQMFCDKFHLSKPQGQSINQSLVYADWRFFWQTNEAIMSRGKEDSAASHQPEGETRKNKGWGRERERERRPVTRNIQTTF